MNLYSPRSRESFFSHLAQAKLIIIDNCSTTLLYALSFNIPTILFWNKSHFIFRDEAKSYLEELERVGIYYHSPEAAAIMVNNIIDDPYGWWNSCDIQAVRKNFCDNFIRISPNYLQEWHNLLLNLHEYI